MTREKLPNRRHSRNSTLYWRTLEINVQLGFYDAAQTRLGEVFLSTRKAGTEIDTACRDIALLISIALQHGCPLEVLSNAATRDAAGQPEGLLAFVCQHIVKEMEG